MDSDHHYPARVDLNPELAPPPRAKPAFHARPDQAAVLTSRRIAAGGIGAALAVCRAFQ